IIPASMVLQDPAFNSIIAHYNELQLEKERRLMSSTENNPYIVTLNQQLENLSRDMQTNIAAVKDGLLAGIRELRKKGEDLDRQINQVPLKERLSLEYARQQAIKQELCLFLLKKGEETAVAKSSTLANIRIIDSARYHGTRVSAQRP